ncbi:MAG: glycoside hydrolase family 3 C-terminal domain-containing protein [Clostridia bacterium]|nr:glycoside hydrolase family 3 C-terminal domain-containing protein [Clostridia bacterium]
MAEIKYIQNPNGPRLGYTACRIIEKDGLYFKDLNGSGVLEPYKDWRLSPEARAEDLASRMTIEQIAGLMLYSAHQAVPNVSRGFFQAATYGGKPYGESGAEPWALTDQQKTFLKEDNVRHVLATSFSSPETAARWNNEMQALAESEGLGIPVNTSSDPRHGSDFSAEYTMGAGGTISLWPEPLGLAATFDPAVTKQFGEIASKEYRALGITTALSPQVDIATDPRWSRFVGTFGEDVALSTDMARAYCDGFQTSEGDRAIAGGWGYDSVNAMVKHWPGGGSGEGGRDAHFCYGKYAVYPGGGIELSMKPFTEGAFKLEGGTGRAAAVMPYYTISHGQSGEEDVGNAYSRRLITDELRGRFGYDGVVCTDWGVTHDEGEGVAEFAGKCWGAETLTEAERHYRILMAGVDQFGGNNDMKPVLEAYALGVKEHGEAFMRARFELSARRLLMGFFRTGLFENPYLDVEETVKTVACPAFMQAGYAAQLKSLILAKNAGNRLPMPRGAKVFVPMRHRKASRNFFGQIVPERSDYPIDLDAVGRYFTVVGTPEDADFALCCIASPNGGSGYDPEDAAKGGNGYLPISLQYRPYSAEYAREVSLAGGDPLEPFTNRSYKGKTVACANESDLDMVLEARRAMGKKPVIVVIRMANPCVVSEFEPSADAIVMHAGVDARAVLDILCGESEPEGLLPMQIPADMRAVEEQCEDLPHDMRCHTDAAGNAYDFGFGLNWSGRIDDERVRKYAKRPGR